MKKILVLILALSSVSYASQVERSSVDDVLRLKESIQSKKKIDLTNGYYDVEDISGKSDTKYEMMVTSSKIDKEQKYVVLLPKYVRKARRSGYGFFLMARPVMKGKSLMLTGVNIDSEGNFVIDSENQDRAPVGLLSKKAKGIFKHDFIIQSKQGGLDGMTLGVTKKSKKRHPVLRSYSKNGMFAAGSRKSGVRALVLEDELTLFSSKGEESSYEMISVNRDNIFNGLIESEFDSMGEFSVSYEQVKNLTFFYDAYGSKEEFLVVARPVWKAGKYRMTAYQSGQLNWIKKLFINLFD